MFSTLCTVVKRVSPVINRKVSVECEVAAPSGSVPRGEVTFDLVLPARARKVGPGEAGEGEDELEHVAVEPDLATRIRVTAFKLANYACVDVPLIASQAADATVVTSEAQPGDLLAGSMLGAYSPGGATQSSVTATQLSEGGGHDDDDDAVAGDLFE
eukprot:TRINITY_DN16030_c0_g1_i1.p2 TRINITY_DN16030_c0_g1~~TRINITY_DN16030_c0_g1_i1.p2  ORF type:complete len:157 (-),score=38.54 TRINITY_DN16030_c0_g1_i1:756-1226(-)